MYYISFVDNELLNLRAISSFFLSISSLSFSTVSLSFSTVSLSFPILRLPSQSQLLHYSAYFASHYCQCISTSFFWALLFVYPLGSYSVFIITYLIVPIRLYWLLHYSTDQILLTLGWYLNHFYLCYCYYQMNLYLLAHQPMASGRVWPSLSFVELNELVSSALPPPVIFLSLISLHFLPLIWLDQSCHLFSPVIRRSFAIPYCTTLGCDGNPKLIQSFFSFIANRIRKLSKYNCFVFFNFIYKDR